MLIDKICCCCCCCCLDANIKYSCSEMVKENPDVDEDGLPKLMKEGGRRRVDSKYDFF